VHLHVGDQGVWVSRIVGEVGASPVLCALVGGETGAVLPASPARLPVDLARALPGDREPLAMSAGQR
jgi:hypothetical protein